MHKTLMGMFATLALVSAMAVAAPASAASGAVVPLPADDQAALDNELGAGVVGAPVAAWTLEPDMVTLTPGTRTFAVVSGPNAGTTEQHVVAPMANKGSGKRWRYAVGTDQVQFLHEVSGASLSTTSEQDISQGVLTRFSPAEPMVLVGLNPGDQRTMTINLSVYDLTDASDLEHSGALNLTYQYVGAYQVTVPAGTFEAALLKSSYNGSVGPASVDDTEYLLVSRDAGIVASTDKRDVSAMLFYNDDSTSGRVLAQQN